MMHADELTTGRRRDLSPPRPDVGAGEQIGAEFFILGARRAMEAKEYALASRLLEQASRMVPGHAGLLLGLGFCRGMLGDFTAACDAYERAVALRPTHARSQALLGGLLFATNRPAEGRRAFLAALSGEPRSDLSRVVLARLRILHGDYERGWPELEARWQVEHDLRYIPFRPSAETPLWDGSVQRSRSLCIHFEGGYGDAIMFCRFIPQLAGRVGRVLVVFPSVMERLLSRIPGVDGFVYREEEIPANALHTTFFSLPGLARVRLDTIPWPGGYLRAPGAGPRLPERKGFRVALVWAGNARSNYDHDRSFPSVELLAPLLDVSGVEWVSLQVGSRAGEAAALPIAEMPPVADFADTAHLLTQVDLVITVDTSTAHLAGALGVPVWIVLPSIPEYRWLLDREDTPWYRSARLFRREHATDWEGVVERVRLALLEEVGA